MLNDIKKNIKPSCLFLNRGGFTLAETLIVVGLIGVVAAATLGIVSYIQDVQFKTGFKKAFSVLSQAVLKARTEDSLTAAKNTLPRPTDFDKNFLAIMSEFKVQKQCINDDNSQCWEAGGEKYGLNFSSGYPYSGSYSFIDASGMAWSQFYYGSLCIFVDTNGFKKPNQWGKDRFVFYVLDQNGVDETSMEAPIKVVVADDWGTGNICTSNACGTASNKDYKKYYGTRWLYQ